MWKNGGKIVVLSVVLQVLWLFLPSAPAQDKTALYPVRAPLEQYLISDESAEIALARTAAPAAISDAAEVLVLRRDGFAAAVHGSNHFVCLVVRSWANTTDDAQFWNPKVRAPHCFNEAAAQSVLPVFLMKSKLALGGKTRAEIATAVTAAMEKKEFPAVAPGAMVYMMSKQQYLNDGDMSWHPHLMFFADGDAEKSWGANVAGSPVMAGYDPEQRVTTFFVLTGKWSDGTAGPAMTH